MNFIEAVKSGFVNYFNFSDRTQRAGYWYWYLMIVILAVLGNISNHIQGVALICLVIQLAIIIPTYAVGARRLHDIGKSGWWLLIGFTIIGIPVLIYWFCLSSEEGDNEYGTNPLAS